MACGLARADEIRMARIVLDAGVVIGLYNDNDAHHNWAVTFMFQSAADQLHISALNFAEIAVFPVKNGVEDEFFAGIGGLALKVDSVGETDTLDLTKLRVDTALRMTDVCAIQLATKLDGILATTDKAVAKAAKALGIEVFQP